MDLRSKLCAACNHIKTCCHGIFGSRFFVDKFGGYLFERTANCSKMWK